MFVVSRSLFVWLAAACTAVAAGASAVDIVAVSGASMEPTLQDGQRVFVSRVHYGIPIPFYAGYIIRWSTPKSGDIVLYPQPIDGQLAAKRVWAEPGSPYQLAERYLKAGTVAASISEHAAELLSESSALGPEQMLVIGDNRIASVDSRHYGPIRVDSVVGKVIRLQ